MGIYRINFPSLTFSVQELRIKRNSLKIGSEMDDNLYLDNLDPDDHYWKEIIKHIYGTIGHLKRGKYAEYCRQLENEAYEGPSGSTNVRPGFTCNDERSGLHNFNLNAHVMNLRNLLTKVSPVKDEDNGQDDDVPDRGSGESENPVACLGLVDPRNLHDIKQVFREYESDYATECLVHQSVHLSQTVIFNAENARSFWSAESNDSTVYIDNANHDQGRDSVVNPSSFFGIDSNDYVFVKNEKTYDSPDASKSPANTTGESCSSGEICSSKRRQGVSTSLDGLQLKKKKTQEEANIAHCSKIVNCFNNNDSVQAEEPQDRQLSDNNRLVKDESY